MANEDVYRVYRQSVDDMGALRLYDHDFAHDVWLPAAGVPWFVTVFGRDSLIVSLQNMLVNPGFARGTLRKLAEFQAAEVDEWRDAEPGKMPHEVRFGELAQKDMGWKDADDAVVDPNGDPVRQPKALCEFQGYVFDAWLRMADVFDVLGGRGRSGELRRKAGRLQQQVEARFWCEETGFYAYGLDADKAPIRTIASNAGHLLWSGMVSRDHAARVVARMFEPDMWSGWGIRTLPPGTPRAIRSPTSAAQCGRTATGSSRSGSGAMASPRAARDIFEAASYFIPDPRALRGHGAATGRFPGAVSRRKRAAGVDGGQRVSPAASHSRHSGERATRAAADRPRITEVAARRQSGRSRGRPGARQSAILA